MRLQIITAVILLSCFWVMECSEDEVETVKFDTHKKLTHEQILKIKAKRPALLKRHLKEAKALETLEAVMAREAK